MTYDTALAETVRRNLSNHPNVVERRMTSGLSFVINGHICCGVNGLSIMIRVGAIAYSDTLRESCVRPLEFAGRRPRGFVLVDRCGYSSPARLMAWIKRGNDFIKSLPGKR